MDTFTNADVESRVWPTISRPDGSTLTLGPGESADLDLPDNFADPYLKRATAGRKRSSEQAPAEPAPASEE